MKVKGNNVWMIAVRFVTFIVIASSLTGCGDNSANHASNSSLRQTCARLAERQKNLNPDSKIIQNILTDSNVKWSNDLSVRVDYQWEDMGGVWFHCVSDNAGKDMYLDIDNDPPGW
jgi:hypothetical protein